MAAHPDAAAARILVVEDDAAIAELIELYPDKEGLETRCVASAEAAESALRRKVFHLVILDINLPGRDGFQWKRRQERRERISQRQWRDVPLPATTGPRHRVEYRCAVR